MERDRTGRADAVREPSYATCGIKTARTEALIKLTSRQRELIEGLVVTYTLRKPTVIEAKASNGECNYYFF